MPDSLNPQQFDEGNHGRGKQPTRNQHVSECVDFSPALKTISTVRLRVKHIPLTTTLNWNWMQEFINRPQGVRIGSHTSFSLVFGGTLESLRVGCLAPSFFTMYTSPKMCLIFKNVFIYSETFVFIIEFIVIL